MKGKILIHSIVFSPDGVSTAYLYNDIAKRFVDDGYEVVVLTTTPHYNIVPEELVKQPLKAKFFGLYQESRYHGIQVIHIPQKKFKSTILRILGFVYWHFSSFMLGLFQKNVSLILSPSPPLTIGLINILLGKLKGVKVIYNVQEIYPDFLINQGGLKSGIVIKVLKWLEKFVYNHSAAVTTIDSVFYSKIVTRFKNPDKLHIIPNFVDTDLFKPKEVIGGGELDANYFKNEKGILKVMYAGNIGLAQDWESLISIAKSVKELPIVFYVVGEGVMKDYLNEEINNHNLINIFLVPYQQRQYMASLIAFADLHFIFMTQEMENEGFPSKVYTIMACSKPLLVISGEQTPISNFLKSHHCAFLINPTNKNEKCAQAAVYLKKCITNPDILSEMGANGYHVVKESYTKEAVTSQYLNLIAKTISAND